MILKLFGLPRTCTNLTKYMIETYVQEDVTVWHHRPGFEDCLYHKHGAPRRTPGADGYLLCTKPFDDWLISIQARTPELSVDDSRAIWNDWRHAQIAFLWNHSTPCFVVSSAEWEQEPKATLERICRTFGLTQKPGPVTLPTGRLSRGGDTAPTVETEEEWSKRCAGNCE